MTESPAGPVRYGDEVGVSLLALGGAILRWRRRITIAAAIGMLLGALMGLLSPRVYTSSATFIPQGAESSQPSALAAAASQFGVRLPSSGGSGWGAPVYVDLLRSRTLLEPLVRDTFTVKETATHATLLDLLKVSGDPPALRTAYGVRLLQQEVVGVSEDKTLGAVNVTVTTRWPSLSYAVAQRLIDAINRFNVEKRRSQATAERQFAQERAAEAEGLLRAAEERLKSFSQQNRAFTGSPELSLERDRLQRDVTLRQQLYTSLLQNREEARLREVRDTPVITMLEEPQLPAVGEARKTLQKMIFGAFVGVMLGVLLALVAQRVEGARQAPSDETRAFFALVDEATPRLFRRGAR